MHPHHFMYPKVTPAVKPSSSPAPAPPPKRAAEARLS
jgi:hypothetical protein